jgi:hypothetical protein
MTRKAKNPPNGEEGTSQDASGVGRDETRTSKTNRTPADPVGGPAAKRLKVLGIWSEAGSTEQAQRKVRSEIRRLAREICITDATSADPFDWCLLIEQILRMPEMVHNWRHWSPGGARNPEIMSKNPVFYEAINNFISDALKKVPKPTRDAIRLHKQRMVAQEVPNSLPELRERWSAMPRPGEEPQKPSTQLYQAPKRPAADDLCPAPKRVQGSSMLAPQCEETILLVIVDPKICTSAASSSFPWKWPGRDPALRFQLVSLETRSMSAFVALCRDSISDETRRIRELWGVVCGKTEGDSPPLEEVSELSNDSSLRAWLRETATFRRHAYCVLQRTEVGSADTPRAFGKPFNEYNFVPLPPIIDLDENNDDPAQAKGPIIPRPTSEGGFVRWCERIDRRMIRLRRLRHLVCVRANMVLNMTDFNPRRIDASQEPWNRPASGEADPGRDPQEMWDAMLSLEEDLSKEITVRTVYSTKPYTY